MLQIAIVSPLPPTLRFGRQVGAFGHLHLIRAIIVTPLRGWGLPAFHPTKRNDRVILPVPPYAGSRISGLESHTHGTYRRVTKQVGSW